MERLLGLLVYIVLVVNLSAEPEGKKVQLSIQVEIPGNTPRGSLLGCLPPALLAADVDWSCDYLRGYLGHAFAFSMNPDGGEVAQAINWEWL